MYLLLTTGGSLSIAVKKMYGNTEQKVEFTELTMLRVEPPDDLQADYVLPSEYLAEAERYPLMYGDGRVCHSETKHNLNEFD